MHVLSAAFFFTSVKEDFSLKKISVPWKYENCHIIYNKIKDQGFEEKETYLIFHVTT